MCFWNKPSTLIYTQIYYYLCQMIHDETVIEFAVHVIVTLTALSLFYSTIGAWVMRRSALKTVKKLIPLVPSEAVVASAMTAGEAPECGQNMEAFVKNSDAWAATQANTAFTFPYTSQRTRDVVKSKDPSAFTKANLKKCNSDTECMTGYCVNKERDKGLVAHNPKFLSKCASMCGSLSDRTATECSTCTKTVDDVDKQRENTKLLLQLLIFLIPLVMFVLFGIYCRFSKLFMSFCLYGLVTGVAVIVAYTIFLYYFFTDYAYVDVHDLVQ